jgi:hypothetical protein
MKFKGGDVLRLKGGVKVQVWPGPGNVGPEYEGWVTHYRVRFLGKFGTMHRISKEVLEDLLEARLEHRTMYEHLAHQYEGLIYKLLCDYCHFDKGKGRKRRQEGFKLLKEVAVYEWEPRICDSCGEEVR